MMKKRDFITLQDLSREKIEELLDLAREMKNDASHSIELLKGKTIGLVFQKPSNRTRVSFEVGITQMGGKCVYLGPYEINLGVRETTSDVAKTLSRYLDGIVARVNLHADIQEMKNNTDIPIINGLCDIYHPCQALTDLFSIREKLGQLEGIKVAFIGDGNNVCHSLLLGGSKVGLHISVATPEGYKPKEDIVALAKKNAQETKSEIHIGTDPQEAVKGADVIYSDVWVSMGQEKEKDKKLKEFEGFQINEKLVWLAKKDYVFMHCLPAHRDEEVTSEIIDGEHSIVFDQAENRLHTQKAILNYIFNTWA